MQLKTKHNINRLFAVAMLLPCAFLFLYALTSNTNNSIARAIFKSNKNTTTVEAKVYGWGFTGHRSNKGGSSFSYDYGVVYTFNNHKYYATVNIVSHTKNKNGETYYKPLPQSILLVINTAQPQQYIYQKRESGSIVFALVMLAIIVGCVYSLIRPATSFYFKTPHKGFSANANNIVLKILAVVPFVICFFSIKNAIGGNKSRQINGYEIISERTPFATEMYTNLTTYNSQTVDYISMEIDKTYLQETDTVKAYSNSNDDYKLQVKKVAQQTTVRLLIYNIPKQGLVYIITSKGKYIATPNLYH